MGEAKKVESVNEESDMQYPPRTDPVALRESLFKIKHKEVYGDDSYRIPIFMCERYFENTYNIPRFMAQSWLSILVMSKLVKIIKENTIWYIVIKRKM